jgi:transcriptional regulator
MPAGRRRTPSPSDHEEEIVYVPHSNAVPDEAEVRRMVAEVGSAQLVTVDADGFPVATLLPVVWTGDVVTAHMARANPHWRAIAPDAPTLLVVTGAQAYVSPSWYASKAEHGRVVPTWNYSAVHLTGRARVHEDAEELRRSVDALVEHHEAHRERPWRSSDAPERYITAQLRGIVGVEVRVERVAAKAKLSQNRSAADREGVVRGLRRDASPGAARVADQMERLLPEGG